MMDIQATHVELDHTHPSPLLACRFSPDGATVFFAAEDYSVWRWNLATDEKVAYPTAAWVRSIEFTADGQSVVTGGYDGRLLWWPAIGDVSEPVRAIDAHVGWIRAIARSPDGTRLASVGNDLIVRLWNLGDGSLQQELAGQVPPTAESPRHTSYIYNVAFHPTEPALVTGDLMGQLIHWNLDTGAPVRSWTAESLSKYDPTFRAQVGGFRSLVFTADGSKLLASGITQVTNAFAGVGNPSVVEFDWQEGKQLVEYLSKPALQGVAWRAVVHPTGTIIAAHGGSGGTLVFWTPGTAETAHQFKLPQNARDLDLAADGLRLAVAGSDGHLRVCRMEAKAK